MKQYGKRTAMSLLLLLVTAAALSGCANSNKAETQPTASPEGESGYYYRAETLCTVESSEEKMDAVEPALLTESGYYAIGGVYGEEKIPEGAEVEYEGQFRRIIPCLSFVDLAGTVKVLPSYAPAALPEDDGTRRDFDTTVNIEGVYLRTDGNLAVLECQYSSWTEAGEQIRYGTEEYMSKMRSETAYYFRTLSPDGGELECARLSLGEEDAAYLYGSCLDEENRLVVSVERGIRVYDHKGEQVTGEDLEGYVYSVEHTRNGQVAILYYDLQSSENGMKIILFDSKNCTFGEAGWAPVLYSERLFRGGGAYDLLVSDSSTLYGYPEKTGDAVKILKWLDCDLIGSSVFQLLPRDDGSFLLLSVEYDEARRVNNTVVIALNKVPLEPGTERETLTLATTDGVDDLMMKEIIRFNRTHPETRIEVKDYSEFNTAEDYSIGLEKLSAEIMAGQLPDLMNITVDQPYQRYAASGVLVDLYPYLDGDSQISRDDLIDNVLSSAQVGDGLFMISPGFSVYTAAGASSVVGEEPGLTYERYAQCLSTMPEGCEGFDSYVTNEDMLNIALALDLGEFADWTTGECHFNTDKFARILEYASTFPAPADSDSTGDSSEDSSMTRISEGRQMLMMTIISSLEASYQNYDQIFGGRATLTGFPTNSGVGNMAMILNGLGITRACQDRDTAWEFIRQLLTEDYQKQQYYLPINRNIFDEKLRESMVPKYETDRNGNYLLDENGERIPKELGTAFDGTTEYTIYAFISEHQGELIRRAVNDSTRLFNYDKNISEIVTNEAQAFFTGQKSAAEVSKIIQSKVSIYINEQR